MHIRLSPYSGSIGLLLTGIVFTIIVGFWIASTLLFIASSKRNNRQARNFLVKRADCMLQQIPLP